MKIFSLLIIILATTACQKAKEPVLEQREVRYDPQFEKNVSKKLKLLSAEVRIVKTPKIFSNVLIAK
ncbi:MAG: hypothetical protein H0V66_00990 [Bdellovibrionales bacterium]|nr:hypothetical protein [Bdellovibrionales bacterium]